MLTYMESMVLDIPRSLHDSVVNSLDLVSCWIVVGFGLTSLASQQSSDISVDFI